MDLKLKRLLEQAQFTKYKGRGYDAAEVDDFLDRATAMAAKVEVQLTEALGRSGTATSTGEASEPSGPSPEEIEAEIDRRVQAKVAAMPKAPAAPAPVDHAAADRAAEDAAEEARRTLVLAQRTADAAVREARDEADQLLAKAREQATSDTVEAEDHAQRLRADADTHAKKVRDDAEAEARRKRDEASEALVTEIRQLDDAREALRADVESLERHVGAQQGKITSAIDQLQRVLDDPDGIRLGPAPATDAPVPDMAREARRSPSSTAPTSSSAEADESPAHETPEPPPSDEASADVEPTVAEVVKIEPSSAPSTFVSRPSSTFASPPPSPRRGSSPSPAVDPLSIAGVDHATPGRAVADAAPSAAGPLTTPVDAVDLDLPAVEAGAGTSDPSSTDDAFLAELRKAMADDEPLGPRDTEASSPSDLFGEDRPRRFGRRR